jgi:polyphosphate:AMP phosphotransferase
MFETAELGRTIEKEEYEAKVATLRTSLLQAQTALGTAKVPVIVVIDGVEGSGRSSLMNLLSEWFDARYVKTEAYTDPTEEERERPEYWRYWMWLPEASRIGVFLGSWYTRPLTERALGRLSDEDFAREISHISRFERTHAEDGALIIKLWLHISKKEQKRRLEKRAASKHARFRVTKQDWEHHRHYADFLSAASQAVRETSTGKAPWTIVEATCDRYRDVTAVDHILTRIEEHVKAVAQNASKGEPEASIEDPDTILDKLDLSLKLEKREYREQIDGLQARLARLARKLTKRERGAILLFEGWDAAGKGGAIRRVTWALDARQYRAIPISAPNEEERAHHYLWRFWRHLPRRGRITIYDRSWYGRVLVERVEGFATRPQWMRAYQEINEFEKELVDDGIILVKFWLHISGAEQLRRFEARQNEPWKQYKITGDDFRNRAKSQQYERAAADMIERNSTEYAPFTLVEAEDKYYARVKVLRTICERLEAELD